MLFDVERVQDVVVESFRLHQWSSDAQTWSEMGTPQFIGRVVQAAKSAGARVHFQEPVVMQIARRSPYWRWHLEKHGDPKNPHARSALLHGLYALNFGDLSR